MIKRIANIIQIRTKTDFSNAPKYTVQNNPIIKKLSADEIAQNLNDPFPFRIVRRESGFLPVYRNYKNGRTRSVTIVRGLEGNVDAFVEKISEIIPRERITVGLGNQVRLNGNYVYPIREWLTAHKF
ncbi:hypothetical protein HDV01_002901 [Terramyces sp. JEL0728]|nr:hypothetical protein HDV01_002901 [Terramyces sp. JEL0728]